jgi:hypothetical protein
VLAAQAGEQNLRNSGLGYTIVRPGPLLVRSSAESSFLHSFLLHSNSCKDEKWIGGGMSDLLSAASTKRSFECSRTKSVL